MSKKQKLTLLSIILLAFFLRFFNLDVLPKSPHIDEVMNAYVGRFTLQNGVDLYGNSWPILYFDNFGDYPNILPMYLSGSATMIFGKQMWAVRLPIALFGVLAVYLVFLLSRKIFNNNKLALFSAFSLAIMPWHIVLSRSTAEGITASTVFILALLLILNFLKSKKTITILLSFVLLMLSYLLYPSYRVIVPVVLFLTIFLTDNKKSRWQLIILTGLAFLTTIMISQSDWGRGRFDQTSILGRNSVVFPMQSSYIAGEGHNNALKARLFFNKPLMLTKEFFKQYMTYFSSQFFFSDGGLPMRYSVPEQGVWYYSYLLILLISILICFLRPNLLVKVKKEIFLKKINLHFFLFLIALLLLAPVPAALTCDDVPNIHRAALMAILLNVLMALPFYSLTKIKLKRINLASIMLILICLESVYFWNKYTVHSDAYQLVHRGPAITELAKFISNEQANYDQIFLERKSELPISYLFLNDIYDPALAGKFQKSLQIDHYDNIYFTQYTCPTPLDLKPILFGKNNLLIVSKDCFKDWTKEMLDLENLIEINQIKDFKNNITFRVYLFQP